MNAALISQRPKEASGGEPPAYGAAAPFDSSNLSFTLNGVPDARFESFALEIDNGAREVRTLNGERWCGRHAGGRLRLSGSVTMEFDSDEERRRLWGGPGAAAPLRDVEPGSLNVVATHREMVTMGYSYSLEIDVPEIYYEAAGANISSVTGRIVQTVRFFAAYDRANEKYFDIKLINGESGYPDP